MNVSQIEKKRIFIKKCWQYVHRTHGKKYCPCHYDVLDRVPDPREHVVVDDGVRGEHLDQGVVPDAGNHNPNIK